MGLDAEEMGRLGLLEERVARLESRFGAEGAAPRESASKSERIAALEARVAELEAKLDGKH